MDPLNKKIRFAITSLIFIFFDLFAYDIFKIKFSYAQNITRDSATIIMYHKFGESKFPSTNVTLNQFEEHLKLLTNGNYNVISLNEIVNTLKQGKSLPDRTVAITIDDAYLSVYNEAWPRLKELGLPFTIFVATDPIDRNYKSYMSWDQLRELQKNGVSIGSQTASHPHMHLLTKSEAEMEIKKSNNKFLQELGIRPEIFAYPYGEYNNEIVDVIKNSGFEAAFGQNSGILHSNDDFFKLPRFAFNEIYGSVERMKLAVDGLPLKVTDITPDDMVLKVNPPIYGFTISDDMKPIKKLRCFSSKYGKLDVTLLGSRAEIRLPGPLPSPRARINCTMPVIESNGRWRWFGKQFLIN